MEQQAPSEQDFYEALTAQLNAASILAGRLARAKGEQISPSEAESAAIAVIGDICILKHVEASWMRVAKWAIGFRDRDVQCVEDGQKILMQEFGKEGSDDDPPADQ